MTEAQEKLLTTLKLSISTKTEQVLLHKQAEEQHKRKIFEIDSAVKQLIEEISYQNGVINLLEMKNNMDNIPDLNSHSHNEECHTTCCRSTETT